MTTVYDVVKQICLGLPETDEIISHGFPSYRVRGKHFATYSLNHHGDGKVALLLNIGRETQTMLVESAPKHFFVPPYTGVKGWVGVELNQGLQWQRISDLTWQAFSRIAPDALVKTSEAIKVEPPTELMKPEDIDPLQSKANQAILNELRKICLAFPETSEDSQFGNPAFRAGKKSFCTLFSREGRTTLQVWVGADHQLSLTSMDERFAIPPYVGHNGWINLDLSSDQRWEEITGLCDLSYRHFALKRMLKALDGG